jgi:hypothetical protein
MPTCRSRSRLLSGDRPRGPRRRAGRNAHALRARRHPPAPDADRRGAGPARAQGRRSWPAERAAGLAEALALPAPETAGYFGEEAEPCGNCDLCESPPEASTPPAVRKALSAILRTGEASARASVDILRGDDTDKVRERGHDRCRPSAWARSSIARAMAGVFRQMMGRDLVRPDPERHGALALTEAARPVLQGRDHAGSARRTR